MLSNPHSWRLLSTALLVIFITGLIAGGPPGWAWVALLLSGIAFAVELVLVRRRDRSA